MGESLAFIPFFFQQQQQSSTKSKIPKSQSQFEGKDAEEA
jgi:hypothetical protein